MMNALPVVRNVRLLDSVSSGNGQDDGRELWLCCWTMRETKKTKKEKERGQIISLPDARRKSGAPECATK